MKTMKTRTRSARHVCILLLTAIVSIISSVGVAYAAEPTDIGNIGTAIMQDEKGIIYTVDENGQTTAIGSAVRMEADGTVIVTDEDGNETVFAPYLAPALCMDEMGNLIYAEDGFSVVSMLSDAFETDADGNIVDGMQTIGKAPFVVGKWAEDGKITLVDAEDNILYFELVDGKAELVAMMTPAIYMDGNGVVISVDYFGRETVISAPEFVPAPVGYDQEAK